MSEAAIDKVELADGYDSVTDIAEQVVEKTANAQDVDRDELEVVPVQAIDEAEMPKAIANDEELTQTQWDEMRRILKTEVEDLAPNARVE